jgi:hypothetical protein
MNEAFDSAAGEAAAVLPAAALDTDVLVDPTADVADRSMLVVQYALAVIAAVCAILLSRAS